MKPIQLHLEINAEQSAMERFAMTFTHNFDDAKDLVQDTFMKALRHSSLYQEGTNVRAWLYVIMKNTFINDYNRAVRKKKIIYTNDYIQDCHLISTSTINLGVGMFMQQDINTALRKLSPLYKIPFLKFFEGYRYLEIAEELRIPVGTVKTRIYFARKVLQHQLQMYKAEDIVHDRK